MITMNVNDLTRIDATHTLLYAPKNDKDWLYSHHPFIAVYKNVLYAMWSSGRVHEDLHGQRVMMASSTDEGQSWSEPRVLMHAPLGLTGEACLIPGGFYVNGGTLEAYIGYSEIDVNSLIPVRQMHDFMYQDHYDKEYYFKNIFPQNQYIHLKTIILSSRNGKQWQRRSSEITGLIPNMPPVELQSDRLIIAGQGCMFAISDDKGKTWEKVSFFDTANYSDSFYHSSQICKEYGLTTPLYEAVALRTESKEVIALFRNNEQCLYASVSQDNGQSFPLPQKTSFPNDSARFCFGNLPDQRTYYVGNPILNSGRNPLVLSVSNNGKDFARSYVVRTGANEKRFQGIAKGGVWGYPHAVVFQNKIFIIYSSQKESIHVSAITITY